MVGVLLLEYPPLFRVEVLHQGVHIQLLRAEGCERSGLLGEDDVLDAVHVGEAITPVVRVLGQLGLAALCVSLPDEGPRTNDGGLEVFVGKLAWEYGRPASGQHRDESGVGLRQLDDDVLRAGSALDTLNRAYVLRSPARIDVAVLVQAVDGVLTIEIGTASGHSLDRMELDAVLEGDVVGQAVAGGIPVFSEVWEDYTLLVEGVPEETIVRGTDSLLRANGGLDHEVEVDQVVTRALAEGASVLFTPAGGRGRRDSSRNDWGRFQGNRSHSGHRRGGRCRSRGLGLSRRGWSRLLLTCARNCSESGYDHQREDAIQNNTRCASVPHEQLASLLAISKELYVPYGDHVRIGAQPH